MMEKLKTKSYSRLIASILLVSLSLLLLDYSVKLILEPSFSPDSLRNYLGYLLVFLACLLVIFYRWLVNKIIWLSQEVYRLVSAIIMVLMVGIEGALHFFSIPHIEGWWIPMLGGGLITTVVAYFHKLKSKIKKR
ncbi:MAG: hypothetical protein ACK5BE_04445 [Alphaproteobacteria bacterium]